MGGLGAGIYNDANGTVLVQHSSLIIENIDYSFENSAYEIDVYNLGVLYQDSTSEIDGLYGNPAIPFDPNIPLPPTLQVSDATVTEGNKCAVAAQFTVTLSAASTETITVAYATADGSATAGSDYQSASGTLTFAPGETSKTVSVQVNPDRLVEPNETFVVSLSAATNANIIGHGTGTIMDGQPRISITDVSKQEGKKGQTTLFTFTITLSAPYDQPVKVSFKTLNAGAKSGKDYVAKSGRLTFAPGETTKTITIKVKGNNKKTPDKTFLLDLYKLSSNAAYAKHYGTGTILNDD